MAKKLSGGAKPRAAGVRGVGRPPKFGQDAMSVSLRVRMTKSAKGLLEFAVSEGLKVRHGDEVKSAKTEADVFRAALDYFFENNPSARRLAKEYSKTSGGV